MTFQDVRCTASSLVGMEQRQMKHVVFVEHLMMIVIYKDGPMLPEMIVVGTNRMTPQVVHRPAPHFLTKMALTQMRHAVIVRIPTMNVI